MRGSGFITPTAPESMTHSTSTPRPGPTCRISAREALADQAVGVRDDAEPDAGVGERARGPSRHPGSSRSQSAASANSLSRCRCTSSRGPSATPQSVDVALEVRLPAAGPVRFDVEVGREASRGW